VGPLHPGRAGLAVVCQRNGYAKKMRTEGKKGEKRARWCRSDRLEVNELVGVVALRAPLTVFVLAFNMAVAGVGDVLAGVIKIRGHVVSLSA
jgi:hypothetical protein